MPSQRRKVAKATEVRNRRAVVAEMYLGGKYLWEIAQYAEVSIATISKDLEALRTEWKQSALRDFDERRGQELAKIDDLERMYRVSFLKSMGKDGKGPGNPQWGPLIQWCVSKRCEILGLDAPKQLDVSGNLLLEVVVQEVQNVPVIPVSSALPQLPPPNTQAG